MSRVAVRPETAVTAAALVAAGALPGAVLTGAVTAGSTVVAAVGGALAAAALVPAVGAAHRRGRATAAVVGVAAVAAAAAGLVALAAWRPGPAGGPTRRPPAAVADALVHGWAAVATAPVPTDPSPRTLVPVALTALVATAAALVLARRRPTGAAPLLPVTLAFALAVVAAGRAGRAPLASALALAATGASVLAVRTERTRRARRSSARGSWRHAGPAAALAVVVAAGALVVGPRLTFGRDDRTFDARDHVTPPAVPSVAAGPLDLATGRRRQPDLALFTVQGDAAVTTRLVALDAFDGARWSASGDYRPTGTVLAGAARTGVDVTRMRATVTVAGLTGPWLPSFGDPTRLTGATVLVEPVSGTFVAPSGDASGLSYALEADVVTSDLAAVTSAPAAADEPAAAALPDGLPAPLRQMAEVATAGATTPLARAVLLERYLRLRFAVDDTRATGQSYGHLVRALTEDGSGTQEQFALAFAVLGRAVGLPTRVVVGFGPGTEVAPGRYEVRNGDSRVWPEVKFDGAGWMAFDPVPTRDQTDDGRSSALGGQAAVTVPESPESARPVDGAPGVVIQPALPGSTGDGSPWRAVLTVAVGLLAGATALAVLAAVAVVVGKRRRTRARRAATDAADRVIGAWHDVLDRLVEMGVAAPDRRTVEELVLDTETTTSALAGLYRPVNRALYDAGAVDEADATQAWRARDRFVGAVRRSATARRRLRWALDPRPLRADHGRHRGPATGGHSVDSGGTGGGEGEGGAPGGARQDEPVLAGRMEAAS